MSTTLLTRLFFLSAELKPQLPPQELLKYLGKSWYPIIEAGAKYGSIGAISKLPSVSADQINELYMSGSENGNTPTIEEFRAALSGILYTNITQSNAISQLDQIKLLGKLERWLNGRDSTNGEGVIDFDAIIETPMFFNTGFWPVDKILGDKAYQEVITILARPGIGKTSICISLAHEWRRLNIGSVIFCQTELSQAAMVMKVQGQSINNENLWRSGEDKIAFGRKTTDVILQECIDNHDPNRLVIIDSVTGYAGSGDSPDSRMRFTDLYDRLMEVKNNSRMVVAASHVKRGTDKADIESAAGSSAVERYSGALIYMESDNVLRPDGKAEIRIEALKNRYHSRVRPFSFVFDYTSGIATELDKIEEAMSNVGEELV